MFAIGTIVAVVVAVPELQAPGCPCPGESGPQIVARIARPDLPVLYMSGYAANELEGLGTARLLTKPFSSAQLIEAVNAALR